MPIPIDRLIRSKRRTIALIVERDGSLTVRAPLRASRAVIDQFVAEKTEWIIRTRQKLPTVLATPEKQFTDGERFLFLGSAYDLKLVGPQRPPLRLEDGFTLSAAFQKRGRLVFTNWYKQRALEVITDRVRLYSTGHGFEPKQVKITSAKTRWGSCSASGNLNFTWRLVMAPLEIIDYVVIHELVHLRVRDHSAKFWRAVETIDPGYRSKRKWLREHGESLSL